MSFRRKMARRKPRVAIHLVGRQYGMTRWAYPDMVVQVNGVVLNRVESVSYGNDRQHV